MANKVFISFRYNDGNKIKNELIDLFDSSTEVINKSEDIDRSMMSESTIQKYLYDKLRNTSVTIVLLTPNAINHKKNYLNNYDDWMYDEIRYSLSDREGNRSNGLIAVYTEEAKELIIIENKHICSACNVESIIYTISNFDNLCRKNMMNVKDIFKKNKCDGIYDLNDDSYCSFVSLENFKKNYEYYIKTAFEKRDRIDEFKIMKQI